MLKYSEDMIDEKIHIQGYLWIESDKNDLADTVERVQNVIMSLQFPNKFKAL